MHGRDANFIRSWCPRMASMPVYQGCFQQCYPEADTQLWTWEAHLLDRWVRHVGWMRVMQCLGCLTYCSPLLMSSKMHIPHCHYLLSCKNDHTNPKSLKEAPHFTLVICYVLILGKFIHLCAVWEWPDYSWASSGILPLVYQTGIVLAAGIRNRKSSALTTIEFTFLTGVDRPGLVWGLQNRIGSQYSMALCSSISLRVTLTHILPRALVKGR